MGAGRQPDYEFFPGSGRAPATGPRAVDDRSLPRRPGLTAISPDDAAPDPRPWTPGSRVSAPPPNVPPVFERPAPPPGDRRPWSTTASGQASGEAAAPAPGRATAARTAVPSRPVPAFTAFAARPAAIATDPDPAVGTGPGPADASPRSTMPPAPRSSSEDVAAATGWQPPAPLPRPDLALRRPARRGPGRGAVLAGTLAVTVLLVTAAVVVGTPRWLAHEDRAEWAATSVRIPSKAAGLPRITTSSVTAQARSAHGDLIGDSAGQMITDLAVYGKKTGTRVVVVVGRPQHPLEAAERDLVRSGFEATVKASGVVLTERDPGPLGGWFGCGVRAGRTTMCLAVDAGAVVSVTVTTTGPKAVQTARDVRAAVEQRS